MTTEHMARGQEVEWLRDGAADGATRWRAVVPQSLGAVRLEIGGLGGHSQVWCDGVLIIDTMSSFAQPSPTLPDTGSDRELVLLSRPLDEVLATRHPRGRWRNTLVTEQAVRWYRIPMLGLAPFLGNVVPPLGPYRRSRLVPAELPRWRELAIDTDFSDGVGYFRLRGLLDPIPHQQLRCTVAGHDCTVQTTVDETGLRVDIDAAVPQVNPWWPHVLGEPTLYDLHLAVGEHTLLTDRVGFRRFELDLAADDDHAGIAISVNGRALHSRGAVWVPINATTLRSDTAELRRAVRQCRRGGAVMVRVVGTCVYEEPEFWQVAAEEGMLVWQDLMIANSDPPADDSYSALLGDEVRDLLRDASASPSLAIISGGSEIYQQAEMLGVPLEGTAIEVLESHVPDLIERLRPGTAYIPSSPWTPNEHGPAIRVGAGVAHYFGVGGYRRPLTDVRVVDVRFASESLAFAVPPVPWRVNALFGAPNGAGHDPEWKAGVPRDRRASWDFEDVRDYYLASIHNVDPVTVRSSDPEQYLSLGSSALVEVVEAVLGWWRSPQSRCAGGLVLSARDLVPGAGWGMTDNAGVPKCTWYAAQHRWGPRVLWVDDRGLDGLWVELHHDDDPNDPRSVTSGVAELRVRCVGQTGQTLAEGRLPVTGQGPWSIDLALGSVRDAGYALRFGPATIACIELEWVDSSGEHSAYVVWSPIPATAHFTPPPDSLSAQVSPTPSGWTVEVSSSAPLRHVVLDAPGYIPDDNWFHLCPGTPRLVELHAVPGLESTRPRVTARAEGVSDVTARVIDTR